MTVEMDVSIRTDLRSDGLRPPDLPGFETAEGNWQLRLHYYGSFIEDVTGVEVDGGLSRDETKVVQNRLEGCVEAYEREGNCRCDGFASYERVDSIETVHELARFFRALVATRFERGDVVVTPD